MGELKPLGSEKLQENEKINRILDLTYYQSPSSSKKPGTIVEQTSSGVYGIVKEKDGYYVKKGLNENSLDYIGGLFMKNRNKFSSYAEAYKKLEFLVEQEKLEEATKYVLKRPKGDIAPAPAPPSAESTLPAEPMGDEVMPGGDEGLTGDTELPTGDLEGDDIDTQDIEEDYLKIIQKFTGKLQGKLEDYKEKIKSEDIKYVLNMIISAIDLDVLEEEDKEEILDKFDPEEEAIPDGDISGDDSDFSNPDEADLGETDGIKDLEELIGTQFFDDDDDDDDDFSDLSDIEDKKASKYAQSDFKKDFGDDENYSDIEGISITDNDEEGLTSKTEEPEMEFDHEMDEQTAPIPPEEVADDVKELDINELTDIVNNSVKETLSKYFNQ